MLFLMQVQSITSGDTDLYVFGSFYRCLWKVSVNNVQEKIQMVYVGLVFH